MAIDLKQSAIDPDLPEVPPDPHYQSGSEAAPDDIQGNLPKSHGVGQWVTSHGGEYSFVPSLSARKKFGVAPVEPSAGHGT